MGRLIVTIPDELERKFRETVYKRKGMKKGNISEAMKEAIQKWIGVFFALSIFSVMPIFAQDENDLLDFSEELIRDTKLLFEMDDKWVLCTDNPTPECEKFTNDYTTAMMEIEDRHFDSMKKLAPNTLMLEDAITECSSQISVQNFENFDMCRQMVKESTAAFEKLMTENP